MRIIVCGGRAYGDRERVFRILDRVHRERGVTAIIHGAAAGADYLADCWAREHDILVCAFPARWEEEGRAAGPKRNYRMLAESNPDAVIAFPGGTGTAHMVALAQESRIPVWDLR